MSSASASTSHWRRAARRRAAGRRRPAGASRRRARRSSRPLPAPPVARSRAATNAGSATASARGSERGAGERDLGDDAARAAATAPGPGRRGRAPPRRRGSRASTVRPSAASAPASHSCISARVIASSEANGSSSSSTGLPASSVRANATRWRIPPESSRGRAARTRRARSGRTAAAASARASASRRARGCAGARAALSIARRARAAGSRAEASAQRGEPLGRGARAADGDAAAVGLAQAGDQLEQGRLAAARGADERDDLAGLGAQVDVARAPRGRRSRTRLRSARRPRLAVFHRSLRAHYRDRFGGSAPGGVSQRRNLSPLAREPP